MEVPLYVTTFAFVFNKSTYGQMSAAQKKVIDDHCTNDWSLKVAGTWADFEAAGVAKLKSDLAHEVYKISDAQLAEWKKASEPLAKTWGDNVKKAGGDPDAIMKELKASLGKFTAAY
jgi:TRAP-type C4-dicarboxylate transport system substrate-binding protein